MKKWDSRIHINGLFQTKIQKDLIILMVQIKRDIGLLMTNPVAGGCVLPIRTTPTMLGVSTVLATCTATVLTAALLFYPPA